MRGGDHGIALLMVVTAIAILTLVVIEFSGSARTHLHQGINVRDEIRAVTAADTALVLTRACLDPSAWGPMGAAFGKVDIERLCNMMLGIFIGGRIDLPIGGLSVELDGISGVGLGKGEVEEVRLIPEDTYIGLAGLACPKTDLNCGNRRSTARQVRALLCDPAIAKAFEEEQADGKRYSRDEIIGNLIDWIDPDDNRISLDLLTGNFVPGAGENEDAYYAGENDRYKVKDAPFDSIEELRLVRGINDELFDFLKDKISVHAAGKINVNTATPEIFATLMRSHAEGFDEIQDSVCGKENQITEIAAQLFERYGRLVADVRSVKQLTNSLSGNFLAKPFRDEKDFIKHANDPLKYIREYTEGRLGLQLGDDDAVLQQKYGLTKQWYDAVREAVNWTNLERSVKTDTNLYRLVAVGRVGNMTRRLFAILKREGKIVRTLYYRED